MDYRERNKAESDSEKQRGNVVHIWSSFICSYKFACVKCVLADLCLWVFLCIYASGCMTGDFNSATNKVSDTKLGGVYAEWRVIPLSFLKELSNEKRYVNNVNPTSSLWHLYWRVGGYEAVLCAPGQGPHLSSVHFSGRRLATMISLLRRNSFYFTCKTLCIC